MDLTIPYWLFCAGVGLWFADGSIPRDFFNLISKFIFGTLVAPFFVAIAIMEHLDPNE